MRACSVEILAARSWSSQKPGSPICFSSSARRAASASGSKVITDPREAGSDLLQLLLQRLRLLLGHGHRLAGGQDRDVERSRFGDEALDLPTRGGCELARLVARRE